MARPTNYYYKFITGNRCEEMRQRVVNDSIGPALWVRRGVGTDV